MNFFEHQAAARRASTRLVVLFALAVIVLVCSTGVLLIRRRQIPFVGERLFGQTVHN